MKKAVFNKILKALTFLLMFTLPFHYSYNNWILGITYFFLVAYLIYYKNQYVSILKNIQGLSITVFFLIVLLGIIYSSNFNQALNDLVRTLPMLLTPILFLSTKGFYSKFKKQLISGLILGCFVAAIVCWSNVAFEMYQNSEPLSYLFRQRHLNHQLTAIIDVHPTYLSLFVITAIAFIVTHYYKLSLNQKVFSVIICIFLTIFIFFLLARTLLMFFIISLVAFALFKKLWKLFIPFIILCISFIVVVFIIDDEYGYLRKKFFVQTLNTGENLNIERFNRLKATKYMFLEHPILGVGTADSNSFRQKYYLETNDKRAINQKLNAHNQFFEYLDLYGLVGGVYYLGFFILIFNMARKNNDYLFMYLILLFFVANLTESALQRTHGIVYFSVIFSLFFSKHNLEHQD